MWNWVDTTPQPQPLKRDTTEPPLLTLDDLSALLTTLAPLLSSTPPGAVLSSLLGVLMNVSSHPRVSAALLLSSAGCSTAVLQSVMQGLAELAG